MAAPPTGSVSGYHWAEAITDSYSPFGIAGPGADLDAPTSVSLVSFFGEHQAGVVHLYWKTELEINMLGYNLYRAPSEDQTTWTQLNSTLIPPQGIGGMGGGEYNFEDLTTEMGKSYFYWLEAIELEASRVFGPTSVSTWYQIFAPLVVR